MKEAHQAVSCLRRKSSPSRLGAGTKKKALGKKEKKEEVALAEEGSCVARE